MNIIKESNIIKSIIPQAESYTLINNYGWAWESQGLRYDLRHVLNVYGCETNYWDLDIYNKVEKKYAGGKHSMSFDEAIEYLKELRVE